MKIEAKVALIGGGASGLGGACARMISEAGGLVAIADIDAVRGEEMAATLANGSLFVRTDVTQAVSAESAAAAVLERFGRLDILINCAGIAPPQRLIGKDGSAMATKVLVMLSGVGKVLGSSPG